jgi:hypothetical protein
MCSARCLSGLEQIVTAALAAQATDAQHVPVQRLSMTATPGVVEAIRALRLGDSNQQVIGETDELESSARQLEAIHG